MKQSLILLVASFLIFSATTLHAQADDHFPDTPKIRKATQVMLQRCKTEFPDQAAGASINVVDHWAEAQERAEPGISTPFKKSGCFASHEIWEKLVQRNEWTENTQDSTRSPATTSHAATTQKFIDGNQVPSWRGNNPIF